MLTIDNLIRLKRDWHSVNIRFNGSHLCMYVISVQRIKTIQKHTYIHTYRAGWLSHLALTIYMCAIVNFDALAQASDFRIERRLVVCFGKCRIRTQGLWNRLSSRLNARWQTDWAIEDQAKKKTYSIARPYIWSASIQPTRPHCRLAFAPGSGDIHVCC